MLQLKSWALLLLLAATPLARANKVEAVRSLLARGDSTAALQRAEAAVAAQPSNAQLRFLRGVVLMDMGRDTLALETFRDLNQAYPELPDPLNNIGLLQARAGQLEPARQSLQAALLADPGHRAARANLGQIHLMLAVQAWEQLAASGASDGALLRRLEAARALLATPAR